MTDRLLADGAGGGDGTAYSVDDLSDMLQAFQSDGPVETSTRPPANQVTHRQATQPRKSKPVQVPRERLADPVPANRKTEQASVDEPNVATEKEIAAAELLKRQAVLRKKIAVSQDLLTELIRQRDETAVEGKKKRGTSPGLATRFEIHWEKTLRQAKSDTKLLCTKIAELGATGDVRAVSILKPFAHAKGKYVRHAAAKAIRKTDSLESSFVLLSLLKDRKSKVAKAAFSGLCERLDSVLVQPVLAYGIQDASTRAVAARCFGEVSKSQAQSLIEVATSDSGDIGLFALQMYGKACDTESVSDLAPFTKHESAEFRAAAISALIKTQNKQVVRFLNRALKDPDEQVRSRAAAGLSNWSSENSAKQLLTLLKDPSVDVRRNAASALAKTPKKEFLSTIVEVLEQEADEAIQLSLIHAVGQVGSAGNADVLYSLSRMQSMDVRIAALSALTKVKDKRAMPTLIQLLNDPDEKIREKAANGIGFKGNVAGISHLVELLKSDRSLIVRTAAVRGLGRIGSTKSIPGLKNALLDEAQVRCQAVIGLRTVGGEKVVSILVGRLNDTAPEVRYNVVSALGELKAKEAIAPLRRMIEDPNDMVQRAVHKVLGEFGVSVSSDLWKRRLQRSTGAVRDLLPIIKVAGPILLAAVTLIFGGLYWFAGESLGWKAGPPLVAKNTLQAAISPDGKHAVIVRQGGVVDHWDVETGELTTRIAPEGAPVGAIFEPDSKSVLLLGNGKAFRWNFKADSDPTPAEASFQRMQVSHAHNADRTRVVTKSLSNTYFVNWDANRNSETLGVPPGFDRAMAISPDGKLVAVVNEKNDILVISLEGEGEVGRYGLAFDAGAKLFVSAIAFSPDGTQLAYAVNSGEVTAMDLESGTVKSFVEDGTPASALIWTSKGLVGIVDSDVHLISTDGASTVESIEGLPVGPDHFSITANGSRLLVASRDSKSVAVVDLNSKQVLHTLKPTLPR